jgi:HPt (histidine-containing phosphotransfer) domain-containing protein
VTSADHVDRTKLEDLRALDRPGHQGFLTKIGTVFLDDAGRRVSEMASGLEAGDAPRVAMAAHALKGSCAYLGATRLAELCRALEERAEAGDLGDGEAVVDEIRGELETVSALLTEEMQKE